MLGLKTVHRYLFNLVNLVEVQGIPFKFEFHHHKKVWNLELTNTGVNYKPPSRRKKRDVSVVLDRCDHCRYIKLNGVCMKDCPESRLQASNPEPVDDDNILPPSV